MKESKFSIVSIIITVIALVGIVLLVLHAKHSMKAPTPAQTAGTSICYYLNQPSASGNGNDVAYMKLSVTQDKVTGELVTALAEKDKITGTLSGDLSNQGAPGEYVFDGQYTSSGEGMTSTSEQLLKLDTKIAQIGYGEMTEHTDGTYAYKDKSAVTYSLSIPRVDCSQYDTLKAGTKI